jgi:hypothetical protein
MVRIDRRVFLAQASGSLVAASRGLRAEVAVIGGGTGGCAAALAALRGGLRVVMTEETDWVGGQLTAQGVPPDEHPWIESFGGTRLYRDYRNAVREYYRRHYPLTEDARARPHLNPGDGTVSRLTHEPRVSLAVLEAMLAPWIAGGKLTLLLKHRPVSADTEGNRVRSVTVRSLDSGATRAIEASYFIDATEQGDLLPLTRTEYVTGFESRAQTGEPHAPAQAQLIRVREGLENHGVHPGFGQGGDLLDVSRFDFFAQRIGEALRRRQAWTHRRGHRHGIARFGARQFHTGAVDGDGLVRQAVSAQFEAVGSEGVGLDHVGARFDVVVVDRANQLRVGQIQFVIACIDEHALAVEHRSHRSVEDKGGFDDSFQDVQHFFSLL